MPEELQKYWTRHTFSDAPAGVYIEIPIIRPCTLEEARQKLARAREIAKRYEESRHIEIAITLLVEDAGGQKTEIVEDSL